MDEVLTLEGVHDLDGDRKARKPASGEYLSGSNLYVNCIMEPQVMLLVILCSLNFVRHISTWCDYMTAVMSRNVS